MPARKCPGELVRLPSTTHFPQQYNRRLHLPRPPPRAGAGETPHDVVWRYVPPPGGARGDFTAANPPRFPCRPILLAASEIAAMLGMLQMVRNVPPTRSAPARTIT